MAIQDFTTNRQRNRPKDYWGPRTSPLDQEPAVIKVVGVGDAGSKRVERMMQHSIPGVTFAMVNTKVNELETHASNFELVPVGANIAQVWGAEHGTPRETAGLDDRFDETTEQLGQSFSSADLVFVTAGMGGGAGATLAPQVARLAKQQGAFVVGLVTAPFSFEGRRRMGLALAGIDRLRPQVDNLVLVHNDRLLNLIDHKSHMAPAFQKVNEVTSQAVLDFARVINAPQEINLELAGVRYIMDIRGNSLLAVGRGSGTSGPAEAARQAIANPLLDLSFSGANGVLMMFKGGSAGLTLDGVNAARQVVKSTVQNHSHVFIGVGIDESMGDEVSLTMAATGIQTSGPESTEDTTVT